MAKCGKRLALKQEENGLMHADNVDTEDESGISIAFHMCGDGKTLFNSTIWPTRQVHLSPRYYLI